MKINGALTTFQANKITKQEAKYLSDTLLNSSSVDIVCHEATDEDSANSALLMWEYLNQRGINSRIILSQNLDTLGLRNKNCNIVQADTIKSDEKSDTALCVDFSQYDRVSENVAQMIKNANKVVCIDHHKKQNMFGDDVIELDSPILDDSLPQKTSMHYIDSSAMSATSVIYRLFESLCEEIDENKAYDILSGFASDCVKKGIIDCDGKKGEIKAKKQLKEDKNAYEIYQDVEKKVSIKDKQKIAHKIDILANLTPEEQDFYDSLFNNVKLSQNKKLAYVEISPDDETWKNLGGDNSRTSTILNRFRQNILSDKDYHGIDAVVAFYSAKDVYRLSIHSKKDNLDKFYDSASSLLNEKYNGFSVGGHNSRGGGKIVSSDKDACHNFVCDIIKCYEN